jgi:hypothetical protein
MEAADEVDRSEAPQPAAYALSAVREEEAESADAVLGLSRPARAESSAADAGAATTDDDDGFADDEYDNNNSSSSSYAGGTDDEAELGGVVLDPRALGGARRRRRRRGSGGEGSPPPPHSPSFVDPHSPSADDDPSPHPRRHDHRPPGCCSSWSAFLDSAYVVLNARPTVAVLLLLTLYTLFGNDARLLSAPPSADYVFQAASSVCFFAFIAEIVTRSVCESQLRFERVVEKEGEGEGEREEGEEEGGRKTGERDFVERVSFFLCCGRRRYRLIRRGYVGSFLFLLDATAIVSLIPEIDWLWGAVVNADNTQNNLSTVRASRISRLGSRVGRIIRMVRLVRIFKLYAYWRSALLGGMGTPRGSLLRQLAGSAAARESQMGHRLQLSITRRVIVMVIIMLLVMPALIFESDDMDTPLFATNLLHNVAVWRGPGWDESSRLFVSSYTSYSLDDTSILHEDRGSPRVLRVVVDPSFGVPPEVLVNRADIYSGLRANALSDPEVLVVSHTSNNVRLYNGTVLDTVKTTVWWNERPHVRAVSAMTIGLTIFIIVVLGIGALQLAADAQTLVLRPIEGMIAFVEHTAIDPLSDISSRDNTGSYETKILENTIKKVTGLLRVGFGSTGALIVAKHLNARAANADVWGKEGDGGADGGGAADGVRGRGGGPGAGAATEGTPSANNTANTLSLGSRQELAAATTVTAAAALAAAVPSDAGSTASSSLTVSAPLTSRLTRGPGTLLATFGRGMSDRSLGVPQLSTSATVGGGGGGSSGGGGQAVVFPPVATPLPWPSLPPLSWTTNAGVRKEAGGSLFVPFVRGRAVRVILVRVVVPNADAIADVLGGGFVPYFNRVAKLVHDTCLAWGGSPVSNEVGTGFTLAWVIDDAWDTLLDDETAAAYVAHGSAGAPDVALRARRGSLLAGIPSTKPNATALLSAFIAPKLLEAAATPPMPPGGAVAADGRASPSPSPPQASSSAAGAGVAAASSVAGGAGRSRRMSIHVQRAASLGVAITGIDSSAVREASEEAASVAEKSAATRAAVDGRASPPTASSSDVAADPVAAMLAHSRSAHPGTQGARAVEALPAANSGLSRTSGRRGSLLGAFSAISRQSSMAGAPANAASVTLEMTATRRSSVGGDASPGVVPSDPAAARAARRKHGVSFGTPDESGGGENSSSSRRVGSAQEPETEETRARLLLRSAASEVAGRALAGCLKTLVALRRSRDVQESKEVALLRDSAALRGFRPSLFFGLHAGWAIEGAVGSVRKVDLAYTSPAAAVSRTLAGLAPEYHSPVLMSGAFAGLLSPEVKALCRRVDVVQPPPAAPWAAASAGQGAGGESFSSAAIPPTRSPPLPSPISLFTYDTWDWTASLPPSALRARLMTSILPAVGGGMERRGSEDGGALSGGGTGIVVPASSSGGGGGRVELMQPQAVDVPAEVLLSLPPSLLPFAQMLVSDADLFNTGRSRMADHDRNVSIVGAADIVEHPVLHGHYGAELWHTDRELVALRAPYSDAFRAASERAVAAYVAGKWGVAGQALIEVGLALAAMRDPQRATDAQGSGGGGGGGGRGSLRGLAATPQTAGAGAGAGVEGGAAASFRAADLDFPSRRLYTYLAAHRFAAPEGWTGARKLE